MPNELDIKVSATGAESAAKQIARVGASARQAAIDAQQAAKAQALAAKFSGDTVSAQSLRIVKAKADEKAAYADNGKIQTYINRGYLDGATAANAQAASLQRLTAAKMRLAEASAVEKESQSTGGYLHDRLSEHLGSLGITESMSGATAGIAAAGIVAGVLVNKMREAVEASLEFGETIQRASAKTGLAVETLSTLHYAATVTGGDFDGMTSAVAKMDKTIGQATEGNKTASAFMKALGLNATELAGRQDGAEVAFKKFADTLAATESPIRRVELATALLGKSGADQIPTIIELGQHWDEYHDAAQRTGNMLDSETAEALEHTQQRLKELGQEATGAGLAFTEGLLPALDKILNTVSGGNGAMEAFRDIGVGIGRAFEFAAFRVYDLAAAATGVAAIVTGGTFTKLGSGLLADSTKYQRKSIDMLLSSLGLNKPSQTDQVGSIMDAIRQRNAQRGDTSGFTGVGDITSGDKTSKEIAEKTKAMEAQFTALKADHEVTVGETVAFWERLADATAKGTGKVAEAVHQFALSKFADANQAWLRALDEAGRKLDAEAKKNAETIQRWDETAQRLSDTLDEQAAHMAAAQAKLDEANLKNTFSLNALTREHEVSTGALTKHDAAIQAAADHAADYAAQLSILQSKKAALTQQDLDDGKGKELDAQIATVSGTASRTTVSDQWAINSSTALGGAKDGLEEFVAASHDAAKQMRELVTSTLTSLNEQILNGMMGKRTNFKGVGESLFRGVASTGLNKAESSVLGMFGLGKGAQLGSSSNPMYVRMASGVDSVAKGIGSVTGTAAGKLGGVFGGLLKTILPGFASGGYMDGPAIGRRTRTGDYLRPWLCHAKLQTVRSRWQHNPPLEH
jgi:hypothetical protein